MALSLLLLAGLAQALTWYAPDPAGADAVRAALAEVWPDHGLTVVVGPPWPEDPGGAVWWDGEVFQLATGGEARRAEGAADPVLQVAMLRGWLAREVPAVERPPEPPPPAVPVGPEPRPGWRGLMVAGVGAAVRLPGPAPALAVSALPAGARGPFVGGILLGAQLYEPARDEQGTIASVHHVDLELAAGLRVAPWERVEVWALASGGARAAWSMTAGGLAGAEALIGGLGLQVLVDGPPTLGARARIGTTARGGDETLRETNLSLRPGTVTLELVAAWGGAP